MQLPDKEFSERYEMFMEGGTAQDLEKILQVRGGKKADFAALIKSIESKNAWVIPAYPVDKPTSVSHLQRFAFEIRNKFLDLAHVRLVHITHTSFSKQIRSTLVSKQMTLAWTLKFESSIPTWSYLNL